MGPKGPTKPSAGARIWGVVATLNSSRKYVLKEVPNMGELVRDLYFFFFHIFHIYLIYFHNFAK